MRIAVLNGSPKGAISVTMQYVLYLQKKFPQHEWKRLDISHDARKLEDDSAAFGEVVREIEASDAVLWATPVYVFLVPGPYMRFVELVFQRSAAGAFAGKYAASLTTSVRFFDHAARHYLGAVSEDLGMHYVGGYSAEMYDLQKEAEQRRLVFFARDFLRTTAQRGPVERKYATVSPSPFRYVPGPAGPNVATGGRKILVVSDAGPDDANLAAMVRRFCECFAEPVEVIDLHAIAIRGGCMGCLRCGFDNVCAYGDADDVAEVYRKMKAADMVVQASTTQRRSMSARWKTFWDRAFFSNHVPLLAGKQTARLVSGPLSQLPLLASVYDAGAEVGQMNLAGTVTDQCGDSAMLDRLLDDLARRLIDCAEAGYFRPPTFLGVGGKKVLRDAIWAGMRSVFPRDHEYYKKHRLYDFPRRSLKTVLQDAFFGVMTKLPRFRAEFQKQMREGMIRPLEGIVEKATPEP